MFRTTSMHYRLKQIDRDGSFDYSPVVVANIPAPASVTLDQNYPNPFGFLGGRSLPTTTIGYTLGTPSQVRLAVYDMLGREVSVIKDGFSQYGAHQSTFAPTDLPSGIYITALSVDGIVRARNNMMYLR